MSTLTRQQLEERAWRLPRVKSSTLTFDDIKQMSDDELFTLLNAKIAAKQRTATKKTSTHPAPRRISYDYVELDNKLVRREQWQHCGDAGTWIETVDVPAPNRVVWGGKYTTADRVLHYLRTGETGRRKRNANTAPRVKGVLRINGKLYHLGYYSSVEERDVAVGLAKIGVYPETLKQKLINEGQI